MKIIFKGKHTRHCFNSLVKDELYEVTVDIKNGEFKLPIFKEMFLLSTQGNEVILEFKGKNYILSESPLNVHLEGYEEMATDCIYIDFIGTVQLG